MQRRKFLKHMLTISGFLSIYGLSPLLANANNKIAIIYYSRTLNTHILAAYIQSKIGGDLLRIETKQSYPKDYDEMVALATRERRENATPSLQNMDLNLKQYEVIFIGSPLWGLSLSTPIKSLLSSFDFSNKILIPFITNAGYGFGNTLKEIESLASRAKILNAFEYEFAYKEKDTRDLKLINEQDILENKAFSKLNQNKIDTWLRSLRIAKI